MFSAKGMREYPLIRRCVMTPCRPLAALPAAGLLLRVRTPPQAAAGGGAGDPVGGLARVAREIGPVLARSLYYLNGARFGGAFGAPRAPLVSALRRLGATELPGEEWVASMPPQEVSLDLDADLGQLRLSWDGEGAGGDQGGTQEQGS